MTQVNVRRYNVSWLQSREHELYDYLNHTKFYDMFSDVFIKDVIGNLRLKRNLIVTAMIPYTWLAFWTLFYYANLLSRPLH